MNTNEKYPIVAYCEVLDERKDSMCLQAMKEKALTTSRNEFNKVMCWHHIKLMRIQIGTYKKNRI